MDSEARFLSAKEIIESHSGEDWAKGRTSSTLFLTLVLAVARENDISLVTKKNKKDNYAKVRGIAGQMVMKRISNEH